MERIRELIKELKEAHECQGIQIRKLQDALNIMDSKLTEASVATDAVQFDHEHIGSIIKQMEG